MREPVKLRLFVEHTRIERNNLLMKKHNLIIWITVGCISLVATFIGMICAETTEQFLISLLPLIYILSITLSGTFQKLIDSSSPGFMIINFLYFIKCVVYPVISVISGTTYDSGNNDTIYAICMEIGEVVVIYVVFFIYTKYNSNQQPVCSKYSLIQNHMEKGHIVTLFFLLLVLGICIVYPRALSSYNFFTVKSLTIIYEGISESDSNGIIALIIKISRYVLTAYLLGFYYRKYEQTRKVVYIFYAVIIVGLTMMIVRGVSRSDFVIPGICGYFLLIRMFPKYKKTISILLLGCLVIVFLTFTSMRYGPMESLSHISETLQAYFCCEKNMVKAIEARRIYGNEIGINTLVSDLFGNWTKVGGLFRKYYNISDYFNFTYHGHTYAVDQIVPTIGQAYMQFGVLGTYTYTVFMVILALKFDSKYRKSDKIDFSYLYLYGAVKCATTLMGNLKIFSATVFNVLFPMWLLFYLNQKMAIAKKRGAL